MLGSVSSLEVTWFLLDRFEGKTSDLLSWIRARKTSSQTLAATPTETSPDLTENLKVQMEIKVYKLKEFILSPVVVDAGFGAGDLG